MSDVQDAAAATVRSAFVFARQAAAEHPEMGYRADHFDLSALDLLIERAERAASLEAELERVRSVVSPAIAYIHATGDNSLYRGTPSGERLTEWADEMRAALAAGSEGKPEWEMGRCVDCHAPLTSEQAIRSDVCEKCAAEPDTNTALTEAAATVRETLRANGVYRYGSFERKDTYDALTALSLLVEQAERAARWLAWSGGQYPDDSPGDVIAAYQDGTIVLDDGITTWNPVRACAYFARRAERAASLEARAMYIASEYDCYCETPGVSNDCAVCEVRAALAAGSEDET